MKRRWKILIGLLVALIALLAVNTIIVDGQTKAAEVSIEGGQILSLPGGEVQVFDEGGPASADPARATVPIVLLHCYSCSLHWFDELAPILAESHRVIRLDLLGHGGAQKPSSGYSIDDQAGLAGAALDRLGIQGAVVVGHSMGFSVATALAERSSQLVDRLVNIDAGPTEESCEIPFVAKLGFVPVLGEAMWRLTPSFAIEDGYADAFAPGFDLADGFPNPDQVVDDFRAMTYTAFRDAAEANADYTEEIALNERLSQVPIPLLSIFGAEDQICDPELSQEAYSSVPGARVAEIANAGHSPNVEQPEKTAALIEEFAVEAGDEAIDPLANGAGQGKPEREGRDNPGRGSKG
jgi:pimeloyl-ACP methyl ester carboxylesterase